MIYWGPSADDLRRTPYFTPHSANRAWEGANWKSWYYQVKRRNYQDSEIKFLQQSKTDRQVSFKLKPIELTLIHHQGIIPAFAGTSSAALPSPRSGRSLLLAAYCLIRLSRHSSAPCI